MKSAVQVLAQIKLNIASVDHFISIACSLADDNTPIRDGVYLAAKEVSSSALLIDHIRNLFSHQQSIDSLSFASTGQHQLACLNELDKSDIIQDQIIYNSRCYDKKEDKNSILFTYSNQLTLYKASKCLLANVAKILYLTDSIVLQSGTARQCEESQLFLSTNQTTNKQSSAAFTSQKVSVNNIKVFELKI